MHFGLLTLQFKLFGCNSLKEKRSLLRPLEHRLSKQFNISIAETGYQHSHDDAQITLGLVNNNSAFIQSEFAKVENWMEKYYPELTIFDEKLEII
jgi:uncharacterized protein YlxP (DUF503 family)